MVSAVGAVLVGCHSSGGSGGAGGASAGGASATGGASAPGGAPAAGGRSATGGVSAAGGAAGTGGAPATGGVPATGGRSATGGAPGTGGISATGGTSATGGGGAPGAGGGGAPGAGGGGAPGGLPASAACTPGVGTGPLSDTEVDCTNDGTTFGIPNGAAVFGKTYVLPSPLVAGGDNALSFVLTGWGPFNFELWGTTSPSPCMGQELLWWGPFGPGTQCAQFKPSKAYTHVLFVYRQMYSSSNYSFATPSSMLCPGGMCPAGTTGTGKTSDAPITAPPGNYEMTRFDPVVLGWDMTLGRTGRMTVSWLGDVKPAGQAQPLSAGVFRLPATDPYGDAWYCIGAGSTLTQIYDTGPIGNLKSVRVSLRGITRLGQCGATPGTGSLSAAMDYAPNSSALFADISGTISSWTGTGLTANQYCAGAFCNFRFRGPSQSHFLHLTATVDNLGFSTTAPVAVTEATWLVQASTTEPFSMACSTEGTLNLDNNGPSTLQLAKVAGPIACPGTSIPNDSLDFTADAL